MNKYLLLLKMSFLHCLVALIFSTVPSPPWISVSTPTDADTIYVYPACNIYTGTVAMALKVLLTRPNKVRNQYCIARRTLLFHHGKLFNRVPPVKRTLTVFMLYRVIMLVSSILFLWILSLSLSVFILLSVCFYRI